MPVRVECAVLAVSRGCVLNYRSPQALRTVLARIGLKVERNLPALHAVVVADSTVGTRPVARFVSSLPQSTEPAIRDMYWAGVPYEWEYTSAHVDGVPDSVLRAAAAVKIAVVDTGCDLRQPDVAAKSPEVYSVIHPHARHDVRDYYGHGTFVASLAAGSVTNGDGIAGFGGDARLMCVQIVHADGSISDVDEAAGIVYAVKHRAKIINLSLGGVEPSILETRAVRYALRHGVLVVAAAGNEFHYGNPVEYPAALLQPKGSDGRGGSGLSVGGSTLKGERAPFSNAGSYVSLVAPGENVFAALSGYSDWARMALPGSTAGVYGFASGTSFATPEVAGAAALVWAANPGLSARQVVAVLKRSASGHGGWTPTLGFGVPRRRGSGRARTDDRPDRTGGEEALAARPSGRAYDRTMSPSAGGYVVLQQVGDELWQVRGEVRRQPGLPARRSRAQAVRDIVGRDAAADEVYAVLPRSEWRVALDH